MSLIVIAQPWSESELSVMLCTLEARGIPTFVQGAGFGSLYPGPQIAFYNARRIMVPDAFAHDAADALSVFTHQAEPVTVQPPGILNFLRITLEVVLFGWFVPGKRCRVTTASDPTSERSRNE